MKPLFQPGKLFTGINYWASSTAIRMWEEWDEKVVDADFDKLKAAGISVIRVFPLWPVFQPLHGIFNNDGLREYRFGEQPLPDTPAGRVGVSEEACEKFHALCSLAEKHGLELIVALITGHMSGRYYAPPAFQGTNPLTDPTAVKWELRFIHYFVDRFKNESCIVGWDLGNECCGFALREDFTQADAAYVWASAVSGAVKQIDPVRPVITGFDCVPIAQGAFHALELGEYADLHTVHPYNIFHTSADPLLSMRSVLDGVFKCRLYGDLSGLPVFVQEIGSTGYTNCSEASEASFYRALSYAIWAHNCGGVMWWCAFDQDAMKYAPYDWNNIGSQYGFFRKDGSSKPLVEENLSICKTLQGLPFDTLPPHIVDGVCVVSIASEETLLPTLRTTYCLAKQANMDISFVHASQKMPESDLYILPSIDENQAISRRRLTEILDRVKEGATLYLSLGRGLFRWLPELSSLSVAYREGLPGRETVLVGKNELELEADYRIVIESCDAQVLATGQDGRPVYVKHGYGKGFVYLSTVPIERFLNHVPSVFFREDAPNYAVWYRLLSNQAKSKRVLEISSATLSATEHRMDDNSRCAVLINYGCESVSAVPSLKPGWRIERMLHGSIDGAGVTVSAGDAAILLLGKDA